MIFVTALRAVETRRVPSEPYYVKGPSGVNEGERLK